MVKSLFILSLFILVSCATDTISDVPEINISHIYKPQLTALKSKKVAIEISDARSENYRKKSVEVVQTLTSSLNEIFKQSGFTVDEKAPINISIKIHEGDMVGQQKDDCVQLESVLKAPRVKISGDATSCRSVVSAGGGHLGGEISLAYENAISMLLQNFDKKLIEMTQK